MFLEERLILLAWSFNHKIVLTSFNFLDSKVISNRRLSCNNSNYFPVL